MIDSRAPHIRRTNFDPEPERCQEELVGGVLPLFSFQVTGPLKKSKPIEWNSCGRQEERIASKFRSP
jgi:hypothetical protein